MTKKRLTVEDRMLIEQLLRLNYKLKEVNVFNELINIIKTVSNQYQFANKLWYGHETTTDLIYVNIINCNNGNNNQVEKNKYFYTIYFVPHAQQVYGFLFCNCMYF